MRPSSPMRFTVSWGKRPSRSISAAMGLIAVSANSRAIAWIICCSSVGSSFMRSFLEELLELLRQLRHDLEQVGDDPVVGDPEDRRLGILVDGDDHLRRAHPGQVLDRARDAEAHIELGRDRPAGLTDLEPVRPPARVHGRARGTDRGADHARHVFEDHVVLRPLHAAAARQHDLGLGQLGSPVETSSRRSTNFICAAGVGPDGGSTAAFRPGSPSAGRKTFGRSVATQGVFAHATLARSLPAYTGRVATRRSPSMANATQSAASPTPSRAASRAANSRARLVTGAKMALGRSLAASSAAAPTQTSLRYGANAPFSRSQTFVAPHSASCVRPASLALSVSHTASARPLETRAASPMTSAITFFGVPRRSSSTMHQNAFGMVPVPQIALASSRSERTSSFTAVGTSPWMMRPGGRGGSASSVTTESWGGSGAHPRSAALTSRISFFFAPMMPRSVGYLGSLSPFCAVRTAGSGRSKTSSPPSTWRAARTVLVSASIASSMTQ